MLEPGDFFAALRTLGVDFSPVTIRKWAQQGIIKPPLGRTRSAKWPEEAVGETAAAYVVRELHGMPLKTVRRAIQIIREDLPEARVLPPFRDVSYAVLAAATCAYWKAMRGIQLATPKSVTYRQRLDRDYPGNWRLEVEVTDSETDELDVWADLERAGQFDPKAEVHFSVVGAVTDDMLAIAHDLVTAGVVVYERIVSKTHLVVDNSTSPAVMKPVESGHSELVVRLRTGRDLAAFHKAQMDMFLRTSEDRDKYVRGLKDYGIRVDLGPREATEGAPPAQRESRRRSGPRGSGKRAGGERKKRST